MQKGEENRVVQRRNGHNICLERRARSSVEELLRQKAERVVYINKVGMLAEGLRENVEFDPSAVWQARVRGRGVYQPVVKRQKGRSKFSRSAFTQTPLVPHSMETGVDVMRNDPLSGTPRL